MLTRWLFCWTVEGGKALIILFNCVATSPLSCKGTGRVCRTQGSISSRSWIHMTFKEVLTQVFRGSEKKKKSLLFPTTFSHMDLMAVILLGFFVIFSTTPPIVLEYFLMKKVKGFDSKLVKTEVPEVFLVSHCDPVPNELRTVTGPQTGCWKPLSKIMLLPLWLTQVLMDSMWLSTYCNSRVTSHRRNRIPTLVESSFFLPAKVQKYHLWSRL